MNSIVSIAVILGTVFIGFQVFGVDQWLRDRIRLMPSRLTLRIISFVLVFAGVLWLVYTVLHQQAQLVQADSDKAQLRSELAQATAPKFPATTLWFTTIAMLGRLTPGQPVSANLYLQNQGPSLARNVQYSGEIIIIPKPDTSSERATQEAEYEAFRSTHKDGLGVHDSVVGNADFKTFRTSNVLNHQDIIDVRTARQVLYFFGHAIYQDANGTHEVESCRYLLISGVFSDCWNHNRIIDDPVPAPIPSSSL